MACYGIMWRRTNGTILAQRINFSILRLDTKKSCPIDDPSVSTCAAALQRDLLAVKMTQAQITEAERLSHERRLAANRT